MANNKVLQKINYKNERLLRDLLQLNMYAKVGILADPDVAAGNIKASDKKQISTKQEGKKKPKIVDSKNISVLKIGLIHEFGSEDGVIPQRSFLRSTADDQKMHLSKVAFRIAKAELAKDDPDPFKVLGKIGAFLQGKVRNKFRENSWEPLKDKTRGGKNPEGNAKPLIDTGQLRRSISYEVVKE